MGNEKNDNPTFWDMYPIFVRAIDDVSIVQKHHTGAPEFSTFLLLCADTNGENVHQSGAVGMVDAIVLMLVDAMKEDPHLQDHIENALALLKSNLN